MEYYAIILNERETCFCDILSESKQKVEVLCNVFSTRNGRRRFNFKLLEVSIASNGVRITSGFAFPSFAYL